MKICGYVTYVIVCGAWLFLLAWTVIGCMLQSEVWSHGVNNKQCNQVLMAWLIIYILGWCCLCLTTSIQG